jgi:hypothetical protein
MPSPLHTHTIMLDPLWWYTSPCCVGNGAMMALVVAHERHSIPEKAHMVCTGIIASQLTTAKPVMTWTWDASPAQSSTMRNADGAAVAVEGDTVSTWASVEGHVGDFTFLSGGTAGATWVTAAEGRRGIQSPQNHVFREMGSTLAWVDRIVSVVYTPKDIVGRAEGANGQISRTDVTGPFFGLYPNEYDLSDDIIGVYRNGLYAYPRAGPGVAANVRAVLVVCWSAKTTTDAYFAYMRTGMTTPIVTNFVATVVEGRGAFFRRTVLGGPGMGGFTSGDTIYHEICFRQFGRRQMSSSTGGYVKSWGLRHEGHFFLMVQAVRHQLSIIELTIIHVHACGGLSTCHSRPSSCGGTRLCAHCSPCPTTSWIVCVRQTSCHCCPGGRGGWQPHATVCAGNCGPWMSWSLDPSQC